MTLNLATHPFVNRRRFYLLASLTATVLLLALVGLIGAYAHSFRSEQGIRRDLRTVRQQLAAVDAHYTNLEEELSQPQAADVIDRTDFLNGLIRQKAVSWTRIFMDLEKVMPDRVQTLSLHPIVKTAEAGAGGGFGKTKLGSPASLHAPLMMDLELTVGSDNINNLLEMLHRMEQSPNFRDPILRTESPGKEGGPMAPISSTPIVRSAEGLYNLQLSVNYAQ